jgi:hypothetical protein
MPYSADIGGCRKSAKTAMAARALGHVNLPVVWGADEDACDRCHAAPIILIATKIIAATPIMGDVPAPKDDPFHFLSFRRTQNNRRCLSFPPYNPLVFSAMYSSSVVRTDGGSFGADNMRSMIDTESPESFARVTHVYGRSASH